LLSIGLSDNFKRCQFETSREGKTVEEGAGLLAGLGVVGAIFVLILAVLIFLMPFFIYGTNMRTKQTALALKETNKLLTDIRGELAYSRNQIEKETGPSESNPAS
jgi:hypothetical protein